MSKSEVKHKGNGKPASWCMLATIPTVIAQKQKGKVAFFSVCIYLLNDREVK